MPISPYGSWPSPISAADCYAGATSHVSPRVDGADVYWLEARPGDAGRVTLVRLRDDAGGVTDVSRPGHNVRSRLHEYGGGEYAVSEGVVVHIDDVSGRVWRIDRDGEAAPITPEVPDVAGQVVRYGGFCLDLPRRCAYVVREDRRDPDLEPVTSLVRLDLDGPNDDFGSVLVAGRARPIDPGSVPPGDDTDTHAAPDFVLDPALSPGGRRLAWLSWNHPNMPWDGTWAWAADVADNGTLVDPRIVAGGADEAIEQPTWLDDDRLVFVSDRTDWSLLHGINLADPDGTARLVALQDDAHDHGGPRWVAGIRTFAATADGRLVTLRSDPGTRSLWLIGKGSPKRIATDLSHVDSIQIRGDEVICQGTCADRPGGIVAVPLTGGPSRLLSEPDGEGPDPEWVSEPEFVSWTSDDGSRAHGFLYRPRGADLSAPEGELPPLIVTLHGGPTSCSRPAFSLPRAYWTSRGFAVLDVDYGGSTGYGRAYRQRLDGQWGIVDVADAASGARHLAETGVVDPARLAITGGSAGGFTTLAALTFTDVFTAGVSHYGIGDLGALARETHKFESRYTFRLVAPWPAGEAVYAERSPINHVDDLAAPLLLIQGTEDRVVPPAQAEAMADALRSKGLPVALVLVEGEGHGFRVAANRVRALELELSFYGQIFGFTPADDIDPVAVENLH